MQLSDVTQQNAALVEESATAAESLNDQARHLVDVVGVFKLDSNHNSSAATSVQPVSRAAPPAVSTEIKSERPVKQPLALNAAPKLATASSDDWESF